MESQNKIFKFRKLFWTLSLVLFGISLACPTYCTSSGCSYFGSGFVCLITGWLGAIFSGGAYLAWFANPFYIVAIFTNEKSAGLSLLFTILAISFCLSFLNGGEVLLNEAGQMAYITGYQIGYWLWLLSMISMLVASILSLILSGRRFNRHSTAVK